MILTKWKEKTIAQQLGFRWACKANNELKITEYQTK